MHPCQIHHLLLAVVLFPVACADYDITVNDNTVYRPATVRELDDVTDPALQSCLKQAITDQRIRSAGELQQLVCSHAGVSDLNGLRLFPGIKRLRLSGNTIRNLVELSQLRSLQVLQLQENQIVDPVPLKELRMLSSLDLSGNVGLQCPAAYLFEHVEQLSLPAHCGATDAGARPGAPGESVSR